VIRAPIGAALRSPLRASRSRADTEDTRLALLSSASAISSQLNFTRASGGMSYDDLNQMVMVGNDVPRRGPWRFQPNGDYVGQEGGPPQRINLVPDPNGVTAVDGVPGSGGQFPTNWGMGAIPGITRTIRKAVIDGVPGLVVRMEGTPGGTGACSISPLNPSRPFTGQPVSNGVTFALLTPLPATMSAMILRNNGEMAATILVPQGFAGASVPLARYTNTRNPATSNLAPTIRWNFTDTVTPIVVEFFVGQWQCEEAATASSFFGADKIGPSARYPHNGSLVVEGARTNYIRNPRGEGAVVNGALPANWGIVPPAGMTATVTGIGSEDGIPFVEVAFSGASTGTSSRSAFESNSVAPASPGQVWSHSLYVRLVAGSVTGVNLQVETRCIASGTASSLTGALSGANIAPTGAPLASQRFSVQSAPAVTDTTSIQPTFRIGVTTGVQYDFTLRFGAPQLELAAFPSSLMLPAAGTPVVSTRSADILTHPLAARSRARGAAIVTLVLQGSVTQGVLLLTDGTDDNRLMVRNDSANTLTLWGVIGGSAANAVIAGNFTPGTPFKLGLSWNENGGTASLSGGAVAKKAGLPPLTSLRIGRGDSGNTSMFGELGDLTLYPTSLSDAQLQSLTA
jgi:hypothetical protein